MTDRFDCDGVGNMKEYIRYKLYVNQEEGTMKQTQPVLLQNFVDKFELPGGARNETPVTSGKVLLPGKEEDHITETEQETYRSGVRKRLHMMGWNQA